MLNKYLLFLCNSKVTGHRAFLLATSGNLLWEGQGEETILSDPSLLSLPWRNGWIIQSLKLLEQKYDAVVKRTASRSSSVGLNRGSAASQPLNLGLVV